MLWRGVRSSGPRDVSRDVSRGVSRSSSSSSREARLSRSVSQPVRPRAVLAGVGRRRFGAADGRREAADVAARGAFGTLDARHALRLAAAADGGQRRLLALRPARLDRVEIAAVAGDDAVELGQRLDLIDDDAAHLRGAFGGFLRQFEDAAAQLGAGGFELALHLGGHLLHALHRLGEALVGVAEHRVGVAGGLVVDRAHRLGGAAALVLGVFAHALVLFGNAAALVLGMLARAFVLFADGAAAFGGRFRHDAGDVAGAAEAASSDSSSRPEKRLSR